MQATTVASPIDPPPIAGTIAYMPPESTGLGADRRADIWALGVVLFEMVAGRRPFSGASGSRECLALLLGQGGVVARSRRRSTFMSRTNGPFRIFGCGAFR
jgi:serine/threonine protein kinase